MRVAAKKSAKREFDWRTYSRPSRLLGDELEAALSTGFLAPLLGLARSSPDLSLQLRAGQATLYYRGTSLVRVRAGETGAVGEVDANLRLPHSQRSSAERLESLPMADPDEVAEAMSVLDSLRVDLDHWSANGEPAPARQRFLGFLAENSGRRPGVDELLVVDVEYPYGRRKFDFVAVRRAESVGGSGAFTTPSLVLGDLRYPGRPLRGSSRLADFGSDASELAHALSGEHLHRVREEIGALLHQKQRLGLLPVDIPFERIAEGMPDLLVVFTDPEVIEPQFDAPIAELHDKLIARRFPVEKLRFAAVGSARENFAASDSADSALHSDDVCDYRAFKSMRKRRRP